jgi:hypothetical protein
MKMGWRKLIIGGLAVVALAASGPHWLDLSGRAMDSLTIVAVIGIGSQAVVDSIIAYLTGRKPPQEGPNA